MNHVYNIAKLVSIVTMSVTESDSKSRAWMVELGVFSHLQNAREKKPLPPMSLIGSNEKPKGGTVSSPPKALIAFLLVIIGLSPGAWLDYISCGWFWWWDQFLPGLCAPPRLALMELCSPPLPSPSHLLVRIG